MKYLFVVLLISAFLWTSCKSKEIIHYTPETFEGEIISFGNRGGFAGSETRYTILSNGQIFKSHRRDSREIERLDEKTVKQLFQNLNNLGLMDEEIDNPGNLSMFMDYSNGDKTKKWLWGGQSKNPSENLKMYARMLWRLAKEQEKALQ